MREAGEQEVNARHELQGKGMVEVGAQVLEVQCQEK